MEWTEGVVVESLSGRTITEADVVAFACLTGDRHPIHTDAAFASESYFGGRIAHGLLVLSFGLGLLPGEYLQQVVLRRFRSAVFKRAVAIGDTLRSVAEVKTVDELADGSKLIQLKLVILRHDGESVVKAEADVVSLNPTRSRGQRGDGRRA